MSDPAIERKSPQAEEEEDSPTGGINLALVYTLLALALAAAILFAVFIVYPFYIRR